MRNGEAKHTAAAQQEQPSVRLRLAGAEEIRLWSKGEVTDPEPIDGRSERPREKGLFSEKIFGKEKDAFGRPVEVRECMCGTCKEGGAVCTKCGTPVTYGRVRRKRFGHIELAAPVVHSWFLKSRPSPLALLLDVKAASLEKIVYFQEYIVLNPGQTSLTKGQLLNQQEYDEAQRTHDENAFQAGMGAEAIQELLQRLDLNQLAQRLGEELKNYDGRQASYERKTSKLLNEIAEAETACTHEEQHLTRRRLRKALAAKSRRESLPRHLFAELSAALPHGKKTSDLAVLVREAAFPVVRELLVRLHRAKLKQLGSEHRRADREDGARIRRLQLVRNLLAAGDDSGSNKPEWIVLKCLPVIPPDLRPCLRSHARRPRPNPSGRAVGRTTKERLLMDDLNLLYQNVLRRNERLSALQDKKEDVPAQILCNEKRLLQEAVDALLDNRRAHPQFFDRSGKLPLKSLTDRVDGKRGVFRRYLLGKMVDYVGRSVIVPGPKLRLHQCGLPKPIARTLFQPFLIRRTAEEVRKTGLSLDLSVRVARMIVLDQDDRAERILLTRLKNQGSSLCWLRHKEKWLWERLAEMLPTHPVLLSRAPTLHRLNLQAFQPVLIEGKAIQLHPLLCAGFGADFDGDAMTVHLPLSKEAQAEAWEQLLVTHNLFSPGDGAPILSPSQEMVMGCYYLTMAIGTPGESAKRGEERVFSSPTEVFLAHAENKVSIHARIKVRLPVDRPVISEGPNELTRRRFSTTVGRVLFNDILPDGMPFYDLTLTDKHLSRIISDCFGQAGRDATVAFLDRLKALGFREATRSGLSISVDDLTPPPNKPEVLQAAGRESAKIQKQYAAGKTICPGREQGRATGPSSIRFTSW
jgi:DNA-directed RNA polymerase subunit beta'